MNELKPPSQFKNDIKIEPIETINHPAHYNQLPARCESCEEPIECIDVVRHMNFNRGNAIKYIWRAGAKNPNTTIEDLQKAVWYLQDEISRLEKA